MNVAHLAPLCGGLQVSRARVEKWISDGFFTPLDAPRNGRAREWTKHDAFRLACFVRLVDAGLKIEAGRAINRLSGFEITSEELFLVVLAYKRTIWRSEKRGPSVEPIDTGEHYDAFVATKTEIIEQLNSSTWEALIQIIINLNDVKEEVERAWCYAIAHSGPEPSG